jgi:hypothetical protein
MTDWILRIEGVNLGATVYNTNQLSVIRGASQVLEVFAYEIKEVLGKHEPFKGKFEPIQLASCLATYVLKSVTRKEAEEIRDAALARLAYREEQDAAKPVYFDPSRAVPAGDIPLFVKMPSEHMTFVHALVPLPEPFDPSHLSTLRAALFKATAICKRMQVSTPRLPQSLATQVTSPAIGMRATAQCLIDPDQQVGDPESAGNYVWMTRDQVKGAPVYKGDEDKQIQRKLFSTRSAHLRKYGRDARERVYKKILQETATAELRERGLFGKFGFAQSVEDIADPKGLSPPDAPPELLAASLTGKLAVIHIDGTAFTKRAAEEPIEFPKAMEQIYREMFMTLLRQYLDKAEGREADAWRHPDDLPRRGERDKPLKPLRLETLIVGGDDATLIVPAWLALELAELLLRQLEQSARAIRVTETATFRAGIAIAPRGTPFRRISGLADQLMKDAKEATAGGTRSALSIQVVESHDLRDSDAALGDLRSGYGGSDSGAALRWAFREHAARMDGLRKLKSDISRGAMIRIAEELEAAEAAPDPVADKASKDVLLDKVLRKHAERGGKSLEKDGPLDDHILRQQFLDALPGPDAPVIQRIRSALDLWDYVDPLKNLRE